MTLLPLLQVAFLQLVVTVLEAAGALGKVQVSSYIRSPLQNSDAGGVPNSLHQVGLAIDFVADDRSVYLGIARAWRSIGLDAVFEGDHLHLELDGVTLAKELYLPLIQGETPLS